MPKIQLDLSDSGIQIDIQIFIKYFQNEISFFFQSWKKNIWIEVQ